MSGGDAPASSSTEEPAKPKLKICCACPETKVRARPRVALRRRPLPRRRRSRRRPPQAPRDECVTLHGPEAEQCRALIEAHKRCLRAAGFTVA